MLLPRHILTSATVALVTACNYPVGPSTRPLTASMTASSLSMAVGDSTVLTLVVKNVTPLAVTFDVAVGSSAFDVTIADVSSRLLWRRSDQNHTLQAASLTIDGNDSCTLKWVLHVGPRGVALAPGKYLITGNLIDARGALLTTVAQPLDLEIRMTP